MLATSTPVLCLSLTRCKRLAALLVALFLVFGAAASAFSAVKTAVKAERAENLTSEQQYKATKEYTSRLEQERSLGKDRGNWLNSAHTFRKIHGAERKGVLGPTSLYMAAKTYRRMFDVFKMPQDLDAALNSFLELADLYPGHTLADDALYDAAECAQQSSGKEQLANELLLKIVTLYPQGDQCDKAKSRLQKLEKEKAQLVPIVEGPASAPKHLTLLAPIKYWSTEQYCRIVLQTAAPVAYTAGIMEKGNTQPHRLFIDLAQSYAAPKLRTPILVRDGGLLKEVRPDQRSGDTVRVVLDLESLTEYSIFSLTDPFRVIVDIRGGATAARNTQPAAITPLPPAPAPEPSPATTPNLAAPTPSDKGEPDQSVVSLTEQKKRTPLTEPPPQPQTASRDHLSLAQQLGLGIRTIVLDPGHGGKDPGAIAFGVKEKDIALKISKKTEKLLKDTYRYTVMQTRTKDVYIPLEERTAIANTHKCDLFISIHINAHADQTKGGIETYFLNLATDANAMRVAAIENATSTHSIGELQDILATLMKNSKIDESTRLAHFVQTNLISGSGRTYKPRDLGVKQAPFYVLIGAQMPAILTELAFLTNPEEAKLLQNEQYLDKIAAQLAAGIAAYVNNRHTAAMRL